MKGSKIRDTTAEEHLLLHHNPYGQKVASDFTASLGEIGSKRFWNLHRNVNRNAVFSSSQVLEQHVSANE
jgi:hypothetical protein